MTVKITVTKKAPNNASDRTACRGPGILRTRMITSDVRRCRTCRCFFFFLEQANLNFRDFCYRATAGGNHAVVARGW